MLRIRKALLTESRRKKKVKIFKLISSWFFISVLIFNLFPFSELKASFNDLPDDNLYTPYIEKFREANIIVGDTAGGIPTGNLRPFDQITRSEFTKITTLIRLLEDAQESGEGDKYKDLDLNNFTLKINEPLIEYYTAPPGGINFKDVKDKETTCASNPEGCEPWYAQYVNYGATHGLVKGFSDGTFKPSEPILRLHALKLLMAKDGNKLAYNDERFLNLSSDPRIENVRTEKCLEGAEDYILENNGGDNFDTQNLVTYASLADRLDIFGSHCEFFIRAGADTPEKRASLLQKPVTRQEIARYFALTTSYIPLKIDHSLDETTSTKEENGMNYWNDENKKKTEEKLKNKGKKNPKQTEEQKKAEKEVEKLIKANKEKAEQSIKELTTMNQEGRCCLSMNLESSCRKINFQDYQISEISSYNYQTYEGGAWHEAKKEGNKCWIPLEDIVGGFEEKHNIKPLNICELSASQRALMSKYDTYYYPRMVREIWTKPNSKELRMFMQIGLDLAMKNGVELEAMQKEKSPNCKLFQQKIEELNSGNIAASLRQLPSTDVKLKEVEKLLRD